MHLQYGRAGLDVEVPSRNVTVLSPRFVPGLPDEQESFQQAVRRPIDSPPLADLVGPSDRLAVVIPDLTRPFPSDRVLPWLFAELARVPREHITILNGTGSHRANTSAELEAMVGREILARYRVVNHNAYDPAGLERAGTSREGRPVLLSREYVRADRRIVLGFIEPHFFAGFSGGLKGVFPALAGIDSIMDYHRADVIGDPRSTWGVLAGNPTQEIVRAHGGLLPADFLVNVALNARRQITGFFCGAPIPAHEAGCDFVRRTAMVPCPHAYPLVVTTNSGYPLDQNLYQAVKGMSAGAQVVRRGGLIVTAARCNDGFPAHGNFRKLLLDHASPAELLGTILAPGFSMFDQWEAQKLAMILAEARVALFSEIPADEVRRAHLTPIGDLHAFLADEIARIGRDAPVAVLPEGPMTIPYLKGDGSRD